MTRKKMSKLLSLVLLFGMLLTLMPAAAFATEAPAAAVELPTADVESGAVEAGTVVTFSCATEGATLFYSLDGDGVWTEGSSFTVNEAVTVQVKAVLDGAESEIASFSYSEKAAEPAATVATFVPADTLAEGDKVAVYYPAAGKVATTTEYTYTGKTTKVELVAADAALTDDGKLNVPEGAAILTVSVNTDGQFSFVNAAGKYLFTDGTDVKFVDAAGDYTLFTLEDTTSTTYPNGKFIKSVNAQYKDKAQYIEYYNGYFTVYSMNTSNPDIYTFRFFKEETAAAVTVATPTADPAEGAVEAGTEVTFSCETEGAVIQYSVDNGENWTEGNTYTVTAEVTILVKAVLGEAESETASFTYTIAEPETVDISDALKGETGKEFTVKGVVTMVEGKNIYIQDKTGGICLYFKKAPTDIALGDTLIGTGKKAVYNGLPELSEATYQKSSGLTLTANETTIAALTTADVCTYVKLTGLEVTEIYDNEGKYSNPNITVKDADGKTIQIYKAVVNKTTEGVWRVAVGDKVDLTAAVGINNATLQLRNTLDSEITLQGEQPVTVAAPTADYASGAVDVNTVVTFSCATEGAVIKYSVDNGENWTEGSTYTVTAEVTVQVKAVLGEAESEIVSFTYTIKAAEPETVAISDALAAETGNFTVKGVVTMVDGKNIYIQDETGGICLFFDKAPTDIALGDTVIGSGTRTVYNGLPELNKATYEKSSGLTLKANQTTIGALTTADICTYVKITGLEVTAVSGTTVSLKDAEGKTIQIYKAVLGETELKEGDKIDFTGAVGVYKETLQLRNTLPDEITRKGELVTDLADLTDGATVAIYSPGHKTAVSSKPNGDWYLKAKDATVSDGKVVNFTEDFVWTVKVNENGTYSFYAYGDESRSITVWPSGKYAELSLNVAKYPDNTWTLTPAKTENCFYMNSPTVSTADGPAYVEAYIRNDFEVYAGIFTQTSSGKFTENELALQFYLVDADQALAAYDDGEWDGVMEPGEQYLVYNASAESSIGLFKEANYAMDAIPTTIVDGRADAGNGAYAFTVDSMGRYYSFEVNGKYLATNEKEELLFVEKDEDGKLPDTAKWFLKAKEGGYVIYNKDASYGGTPVCIEYFSSVFSGWTFSTKNDVGIYLFNFYKPTEDTTVYQNVVQDPSVVFDCEDSRHVEQDYACAFSLDDLADEITALTISYTAGSRTVTLKDTDYEQSSDGKSVSFTIPAADIDGDDPITSFTIKVEVKNSYGIEYSGEKTVEIIDKPFFEALTPAPNAQTGEETKPVISAKVGNVGENPVFTMTVNGETVEPVFENGALSYTPAADLAKGRATVVITVKRADGVEAEKSWNFTVGFSEYQLYFGQLHSHTTYSDGSGSLDNALDYVASLPKSANVQFVAFTDHSNYFDTTGAANPADALNDKSLMTADSRALWEEYKGKAAAFNEAHDDLIALAGFEMTWSGGPGHINTFDSDGLVSRNNAELNNKSGDAGMKLYYQTINKGGSLNQFNHPGNTFGNFTDFSYWDEATDARMFLVEVGNGEGQIGAGGYYPSYEQYTMALDKGWHVAPTNNQDNHKGRWGNANDARDVILTNDFSEQGIYAAIRALRVYATEDKNLEIYYTINDQPMGTIFTEENAPEKLNVVVTVYDPDDSFSKVEVIADGGKTVHTWDSAAELAEGQLTVELEPQYSYYYIKVTQADGDLAVTAPIWVGSTVKLGISDVKAAAEPVYTGEEATLITTLFNNESKAATVSSVVYTVNGSEVLGSDTKGYSVPSSGTTDAEFKYTFTAAKHYVITVTAIFALDGETYEKTRTFELDVLDKNAGVTPIADVRAKSDPKDTGYIFTIEGVVTSNASGYDKDTAFFDCIYVQDDTAGICCFPVSGEYKIGDKVRIVGYTDFYQGEPELQVETIEVIGAGSVEPTGIKASELNDRSAEGKLVTIKGTVDSFELANGLIQTIMVKDAEGKLARVFIDGYITTDQEVENCEVGATVEATGCASYDDTFNAPDGPFPRIRIRDRADVRCTAQQPEPEQPAAPTADPESGEVEEGTVVSFSCETEGAVIMYSTDGGKTWVEGDSFTVTEDVTIQVKAVKDGVDSEIATFTYTVKAEEPAQPQYRVVVGDTVTVPVALKTKYTSVARMHSAMLNTVKSVEKLSDDDIKGERLYELTVEVSEDGTTWLPVTADAFPKDGVLCTMPIPAGASQDDEFYALHLFGEDCNGHKAGNAEMPTVSKDGSTLSFTIKGTSPLLLVWTGENETPTPDTPTITLDANGGTVAKTSMKANADGTVPALPTPQERDGYIFAGWFNAKEGGEQVFEGDTVTDDITLYAHWFELRVTITENAVVPEALKTKYATVDAMKTAMLNTVKRRLGTTTVKGSKLYEMKVEYFDGSEWLPLDADLFPTKGVKVSLTIPSGAATTDRFVALHLFGEDCNGHKAGEGEMPTVTKSGSTLSFTVKGMSPILLVWTGSSNSGGGGTTPKTGDEANLGLWFTLMAVSSAAMAVLLIEQKKRKNKA